MTEEVQIEVRVKPGGVGVGSYILAGIPVYDSALLHLSVLPGGTKKVHHCMKRMCSTSKNMEG